MSTSVGAPRTERRLRRALVATTMFAALCVLAVVGVLLYWRAYLLEPTESPFTRGPYLASVGADTAELRWRIEGDRQVVLTASAPDGSAVQATGGRFQGLSGGTRYTWVAAVDDVGRASGSFTTAPADLTQPVTMAVIADYGSGNDGEEAVGRVAAAADPALAITAGDNSYIIAASALLDRNIFSPLAELMRRAPLLVGLGDHDTFFPGPGAITAAFGIPEDGRYTVDYGPIQIIHLGERSNADTLRFARAALAAPGTFQRRFAVVHVPLHAGDPLVGVLREAGVDAVFSGHLHRYERRVVDGLQTFTVGTGGQGPGDLAFTKASADAAISLLDLGFLRVDVAADAVRYTFVDQRGRVLDHLELP